MDPDCAICHAPATLGCDCEAKGLDTAVRQAEARMMNSVYNDIRTWVRGHAQDYILEYFRLLTERRKKAHTDYLDRITQHAYTYYGADPHPHDIAAAQADLKRCIDEDWQASVQRYPEVLEYYYSLVELVLPTDTDPAVKDPPLSALGGGTRKPAGRTPGPATDGGGGGGGRGAQTIASGELPGRRTPPPLAPPSRNERRRTPAPRERVREREREPRQPFASRGPTLAPPTTHGGTPYPRGPYPEEHWQHPLNPPQFYFPRP